MVQEYTISVFTENYIGLLNRITIIFTRRHLNIESLTVSASEVKGIHRFTIVVNATEELIKKVTAQIEKLVEVHIAHYFTTDQLIYQEIALFKIPTSAFNDGDNVEKLIRSYNARVLRIEPEYVVIEQMGYRTETHELFDKLEPYGIMQFVRSGRIAISKDPIMLTDHLKKLEEDDTYVK